MKAFFDFVANLTLSEVADWFGIISFGLTVWIAFGVRTIQRRYLFTARVPDLTKQISKHASKLVLQHADFEKSRSDVDLTLAQLEAPLKSLQNKVERQSKPSIKSLLAAISEFQKQRGSKDQLWKIYVETQKLIAEIDEIAADARWEKS